MDIINLTKDADIVSAAINRDVEFMKQTKQRSIWLRFNRDLPDYEFFQRSVEEKTGVTITWVNQREIKVAI